MPDADAASAAPATPLFEGRVIVHAPDSVSDSDFQDVLAQLKEAGFPLEESTRVSFTIKNDNVRYFRAEDARLAKAIAAELGATARDFTSFSPTPPAGTIEIWLSGRGSAPVTARRTTGGKQRTTSNDQLQSLRNRILQQLRNGEHL